MRTFLCKPIRGLVLKPGDRIIVTWPAKDGSIRCQPSRILKKRLIEPAIFFFEKGAPNSHQRENKHILGILEGECPETLNHNITECDAFMEIA